MWQTPKNNLPVKNRGYLVLESDDGNIGDKNYLNLINEVLAEFTQWQRNTKVAPLCPNINTQTLGREGKMTLDDVLELQNKWGWEINSHGRRECGIGAHPVIAPVTAGDTIINLNGGFQLFRHDDMGYTYVIEEGELKETFQISAVSNTNPYGAGYITITAPLQNSYTTNATVQLSPESMWEELNGWVEDARAWGIKGQNYANPWHGGAQFFYNQNAMDMLKQIYNSARNYQGDAMNVIGQIDWYRLKSFTMNEQLTYEDIDNYLDTAAQNNHLTIFYGHGGMTSDRPQKFQHIVRGALQRGITILTRQQAVELLS